MSALRKVTITAKATDNVGVTRTELFIDGALKAAVASDSLSWTWNLRTVPRGQHQIVVKSFDAAGNAGSSSITVTK